ncbi:dihydrofolate reductase family protein [Cryobacterium tagatosivorans]|uniref:Pyrimidine reductase n=1 Tax=Cryobacterium tagatosivorans TaxID=1259199 RepID=A0A4R8UK80_9MICO|nr:dihydrofolate reductase family protein [Cryobacterium tagatosivorans]TFB55635.1 pyrimidine reductase [Cryobacterium tagatosivorans]
MSLTRVFPPEAGAPAPTLDGMEAAGRDWLLAHYGRGDGPYLRVNMIASLNGSATGDDGTSNTLTSRLDRRILGVIRELSDVVLVGAGSVRAEGYVVPAKAALAVVTSSGDLSGHRLDARPVDAAGHPVLVLCARSGLERARASAGTRATIVPLDDEGGEIKVAAILHALADRGLGRIVCEGGPVLAGRLFAADVVDEFCLSTSPQVTLGGRPLLDSPLLDAALPDSAGDGSTRFSLRQLLVDDAGATYARWERARPATA